MSHYRLCLKFIVAGATIVTPAHSVHAQSAAAPSPASQDDLIKRIEKLEYELAVQQDIEAVRRLQHTYNYYNTSGLHKQAMAVISDKAESIEIGGRGVYKGKTGFLRAFTAYDSTGRGEIGDYGYKFGEIENTWTYLNFVIIHLPFSFAYSIS